MVQARDQPTRRRNHAAGLCGHARVYGHLISVKTCLSWWLWATTRLIFPSWSHPSVLPKSMLRFLRDDRVSKSRGSSGK